MKKKTERIYKKTYSILGVVVTTILFSTFGLVTLQQFGTVSAASEIKKPSAYTDPPTIRTTNAGNAYDTGTAGESSTSAATAYGNTKATSIVFHSWPGAGSTYTGLSLNLRYSAQGGGNDTYSYQYSTTGATTCSDYATRTWTTLVPTTSATKAITTVTAALSPSQNLDQLCLRIVTTSFEDNDEYILSTFDIWTDGTYVPATDTPTTTSSSSQTTLPTSTATSTNTPNYTSTATATPSKTPNVGNCTYIDTFTTPSLDSGWSWIRENPLTWSLTQRLGSMRIYTEKGDIWENTNNAKNILVRNAPIDNFEIRARLFFSPTKNYQQAGLLIYENDDNYAQIVRAYINGQQVGAVDEESGSGSDFILKNTLNEIYLRLVRTGSTITAYYSADGSSWSTITSFTSTISNLSVGIITDTYDISGVPQTPADFDFFCIEEYSTPTSTTTFTPSDTPTFTSTPTDTFTPSDTPTNTFTPSDTPTFTNTPTDTYTPSDTPTNTFTPSDTPTFTSTPTDTYTPSDTPTNTFTPSDTPTNTFTPSDTPTFTSTPTETYTPSDTPTNTFTPSDTPTDTYTPSDTPTNTFTPSDTPSDTPTFTSTPTNTFTSSNTPVFTNIPTETYTPSSTETNTPTRTETATIASTSTDTVTPINTNTTTSTPLAVNCTALDQVTISQASTPVNGSIVLPGDLITYSITIKNNNAFTLTNIDVYDTIGLGMTYFPGSIHLNTNAQTDMSDSDYGKFTTLSHEVFVRIPILPASETAIVSFSTTINDFDGVVYFALNTAGLTLGDLNCLPLRDSNEISLGIDPYEFTKQGIDLNGAPLLIGDTIEWVINVKNVGKVSALNVLITDMLPSYLDYVTGSITGIHADDTVDQQVTWNIGTMSVDQVELLTFRTLVVSMPVNGIIYNQATLANDTETIVSDNPCTVDARDESSPCLIEPTKTPTKTASGGGGGSHHYTATPRPFSTSFATINPTVVNTLYPSNVPTLNPSILPTRVPSTVQQSVTPIATNAPTRLATTVQITSAEQNTTHDGRGFGSTAENIHGQSWNNSAPSTTPSINILPNTGNNLGQNCTMTSSPAFTIDLVNPNLLFATFVNVFLCLVFSLKIIPLKRRKLLGIAHILGQTAITLDMLLYSIIDGQYPIWAITALIVLISGLCIAIASAQLLQDFSEKYETETETVQHTLRSETPHEQITPEPYKIAAFSSYHQVQDSKPRKSVKKKTVRNKPTPKKNVDPRRDLDSPNTHPVPTKQKSPRVKRSAK